MMLDSPRSFAHCRTLPSVPIVIAALPPANCSCPLAMPTDPTSSLKHLASVICFHAFSKSLNFGSVYFCLPVDACTTSSSELRLCSISCVVQYVSLPNANGVMPLPRSATQSLITSCQLTGAEVIPAFDIREFMSTHGIP